MFTPNKLMPLLFGLIAFIFVGYIIIQSTSILSAPKLEIYTPQDDITTTASIIDVAGFTSKDATVSIDGNLVSPDQSGNFRYQIKLEEGKNVIEIIASKKLSPKSKVTRVIRLSQ